MCSSNLTWEQIEFQHEPLYDELVEPLGKKTKYWIEIGKEPHKTKWLVKLVRSDELGTRGEDWAEWVVRQLSLKLGVPTAEVQPAIVINQGGIRQRAIMSRNLAPIGLSLMHGNELISIYDDEYDEDKNRHNPRYTVETIKAALEFQSVQVPPGLDPSLKTAFDVFTGYLVLDALVSGRDRHHRNWGVLVPPGAEARTMILAPSYDHGNAFGNQEPEAKIIQMITDGRIDRWVLKGKSQHFVGKPSLVEVATKALSFSSPSAAKFWMDAVERLSENDIETVTSVVPCGYMTPERVKFIVSLVKLNRRRLLNAYQANLP